MSDSYATRDPETHAHLFLLSEQLLHTALQDIAKRKPQYPTCQFFLRISAQISLQGEEISLDTVETGVIAQEVEQNVEEEDECSNAHDASNQ